jgi:hypothetical protein
MKMVLILALFIILLSGCGYTHTTCAMECDECKDARFECTDGVGASIIPKGQLGGMRQ